MDESSRESRPDRSRAPDAWRVMAASTRGIGHREKGEPCQDSHLVEWLDENDRRTLVLAVSDGAGSARLSHQGSQLAVRCFKDAIAELRRWNYQPSTITDPDIWRRVFLRVRLALQDCAMKENAPVRDLACTLLAAIIDEAGVICVQLGDGYILYGKEERYATVFKPVRGEFANETVFIVSPGAIDQYLQIARLSRVPERLVLMSDGLERVAIVSPAALNHTAVGDDLEQYGYDRLFTPLFKRLMETPPGQHRPLSLELGEWMDQPRINQRTDDDKTLILAVAADAPAQPWCDPPSSVAAPEIAPSAPASESSAGVIDFPLDTPSASRHDSDPTSADSSTGAATGDEEPAQSPEKSAAAESPSEDPERDDRTAPPG